MRPLSVIALLFVFFTACNSENKEQSPSDERSDSKCNSEVLVSPGIFIDSFIINDPIRRLIDSALYSYVFFDCIGNCLLEVEYFKTNSNYPNVRIAKGALKSTDSLMNKRIYEVDEYGNKIGGFSDHQFYLTKKESFLEYFNENDVLILKEWYLNGRLLKKERI